jgi:hypothetical protein
MFDQNGHLTDEELNRLIDRERSITADEARAHCAECLLCRSHQSRLEQALSNFTEVYSSTIKPATLELNLERRAKLRDRLKAARRESPTSSLERLANHRSYLPVAATIFAITIVALFRTSTFTYTEPNSDQKALRLLPDKKFTPGATRSINLAEVCSQREEDLDPEVSDQVRKVVLQEYGMMNSTRTDGYQVDYLINPQLGGTADVRNLWPEPYGPTTWNAHAKDALEDRLHRMVCNKQIDLASAQHEIATDWIAAYKKYFPVENPDSQTGT